MSHIRLAAFFPAFLDPTVLSYLQNNHGIKTLDGFHLCPFSLHKGTRIEMCQVKKNRFSQLSCAIIALETRCAGAAAADNTCVPIGLGFLLRVCSPYHRGQACDKNFFLLCWLSHFVFSFLFTSLLTQKKCCARAAAARRTTWVAVTLWTPVSLDCTFRQS